METHGRVDPDDGVAPENSGFAILDRIDGICGLRRSVHGKIEGFRFYNGQNCQLTRAATKSDSRLRGIGRDPHGFANIDITDIMGRTMLRVNVHSKDGQIRTIISDSSDAKITPGVLKEILDHFSFRF